MLKTILLIFLCLFFTASGINHFLNPLVLREYMEKRNLPHAQLLLKISGVFLIMGGIGIIFPLKEIKVLACIGLAAFVVIAAFLIHSFWLEKEKQMKMLEAQNFVKNFVIFFELIYLATTF